MSDITWKGYGWDFRDAVGSAGADDPHYNGKYSALNVTHDAVNDYMVLALTKSGSVLTAAEMTTTLTNFGYGMYMSVVGTRLDTLAKATVYGGLFLYSDTGKSGNALISNNEIDINESSAWGESQAVATSHNVFYNNGGTADSHEAPYTTTTDVVTTHYMQWTPGLVEFWSYAGTGNTGTLLLHSTQTVDVPDPAQAQSFMDFNLWVYGHGSAFAPSTSIATTVTIRDVSYTPYVAPTTGTAPSGFFFAR